MFQASKVFWQAKVNGKSITLSTCIKSTKQHCIMEKQNKMPKEQTFVNDVRSIIEQGRKMAYAAAGQAAITTYWNVGRRIVEEEQAGKVRAEYGSQLIPMLAEQLLTWTHLRRILYLQTYKL